MNIVQKVNNREITPRHNNYQEVTVDAKGNGPVISFDGVHARTGSLTGLSPLKQTWLDKAQEYADVAGFSPLGGWAIDGVNSLVSLGRAGYSYMKGDKQKAKDHLADSATRAVMMVPGLDLIKAGKMLKKTGNVKKSVKALNPGFKPGTFAPVEGGVGVYEYDQMFNEGKWTEQAKDKIQNLTQFNNKKFPDFKLNKELNQPIELNIPSMNKPEVDNPNGGVSKPLGKPNKSWTASDYQKYYDNMKKQNK
jgi:hypothetical protein